MKKLNAVSTVDPVRGAGEHIALCFWQVHNPYHHARSQIQGTHTEILIP
jgi:hypothetical protein